MTTFDARRTGWTIEDCLSELEEFERDDPYRQVYYATYSDKYHTDPDCPYIQDSESLHYAASVHDFAAPWCLGHRTPMDLEECSWCASRSDWKFDGHRDRILDGEKTATIRLGGRAAKVSAGDTLVLRDADGDVFGTAPVKAVEQTTVAAVVRDGVAGHRDYQSIEAFRREFREYYPREQITGSTEVTVIEWGGVTPRTEGE